MRNGDEAGEFDGTSSAAIQSARRRKPMVIRQCGVMGWDVAD